MSNNFASVAIKDDGSAVSWGHAVCGGDSSRVAAVLTSGVVRLVSNRGAFVAIKDDGSAASWGHANFGGDSPVPTLRAYRLAPSIATTGPELEERQRARQSFHQRPLVIVYESNQLWCGALGGL